MRRGPDRRSRRRWWSSAWPVDVAGAQPYHAVAALRQRGVVGHQHQRHAALGVLGEQEIDDLLAGGLVEIAGRLVGHKDGGVGRQRAGKRNTLLFAAGELRRIMMQAVAEPD